MKTTHIYLIVISFAILLFSCTKQQVAYTEPDNNILIPGECVSNNLVFTSQQANDFITGIRSMVLLFRFECDGESVLVNRGEDPLRDARYAKFIPSNAIFESFGENAPTIASNYENAWRSIINSPAGVTTVFYNSGIRLIADKDFAGFEKGTNIAKDALTYNQWWDKGKPLYDVLFDCLFPDFQSAFCSGKCPVASVGETLSNYELLMRCFSLRIRIGDFEEVDEDVTFTLEIPVKVGLYLTWLNDKISDPDAPFPYRDETLTCTFTIHKGLH